MANQSAVLTDVFYALADPTRRAIVKLLGRGPESVSVLAAWVLYSQRQALVQVPWLGSRRLK